MKPLVSIIITVYNKASYVRETLEAAIIQAYPHIEIIIVDDGSTDQSSDILVEFQNKYPKKIILIQQENQGVSKATNVGINAAKGDYIQFLDADDLMTTDKIDNQIKIITDSGPDSIVHCKWANFSKTPNGVLFKPLNIYRNFTNGLDWLLTAWNHQEMTADSSWFTSRKLVEKAGNWNEDLQINQDGEFFCRVLLKSKKVIFDDQSKVYYRSLNEGNVSRQKTELAATSLLKSYRCYELEVIKYEDSERVRFGLSQVYLKFIYDTYPRNPHLLKQAQTSIQSLGISKITPLGGPKFRFLSRYMGFEGALRLKRLLEQLIDRFN